nr:MAG TPA: hypothetical protein [Caudoviricetes sp.]
MSVSMFNNFTFKSCYIYNQKRYLLSSSIIATL